jgi:hypothetical protein
LKLLGNCEGVGKSTGMPFSTERGLRRADVAVFQQRLESIALRGLFFIGPRPLLDLVVPATWHETKGTGFTGETCFRSALVPGQETTLRKAFQRLAEEGLYCWFYSLCGEDALECLPGRTPPCQRRPAL